jgi:ubiquinone/menaquinone biosynthesis C-methylase UbiE
MIRVPEQELMSSSAQADAYAGADLSEIHEPIVAAFAARFGPVRGRMLDLGCGTAEMAIRFARQYPDLEVRGIDAAETMLAHGRRAVRDAGLESRVRLVHGRIDELEDPVGFDVIVANSLLHHLPDPQALWRAVRTAARPGAAVMVADLHRPATLGEAERLVATYGGEAHPVLRQDFFNSLCAAYTDPEIRQQLRIAGSAGFEVERLGELHVIAWGRTG